MSFKFRRHYVLLVVLTILGLSLGLFGGTHSISPANAKIPTKQAVAQKSAAELETEGRYFYTISQFEAAAESWQRALAMNQGESARSRQDNE